MMQKALDIDGDRILIISGLLHLESLKLLLHSVKDGKTLE
jgi:hypothetical protein